MQLVRLPGPTVEPVTLAEAKLAARVDGDAFDDLIPGLIAAARQVAEQECVRVFAGGVLRAELRDWPANIDIFDVFPIRSVAMSYRDGSTWVAVPEADIELVADGFGAVLLPAAGAVWPALPDVVGRRVRVDITAGPEDASGVPEGVKLFVQAQVAYWLRNPEAASDKPQVASPFLSALLDPARTWL